MTPACFWKCTPRKFNALCKVHVRLNSVDNSTQKGKGNIPNHNVNESGTIGTPNAFIDQLF